MSGVIGRLRWAAGMRRRKSPSAYVRLFWHDFVIHAVLNRGGERCQRCGRGYVLWHAPTDLWLRVHGSPAGLLCPGCFDLEAQRLGLSVEFNARLRGRLSLSGGNDE